MIVDPLGAPLVVLDAAADGGEGALAIAEAVYNTVAQVRRKLPVLEHRRFVVRARD